MSRLLKRSMPELSKALLSRGDVYNNTVDLLENPPEGLRIHQIQPISNLSCSRLGGTDIDLTRDYLLGIEMGKAWIAQTHRENRIKGLQSQR